MLRGQIVDIIAGSIFLFIGLATGSIVAIRRRGGVRIFVWLAIWSAMYGAVHLSQSPAVVLASPRWIQAAAPYANTAMTFLLAVVGSLAFLELSLGRLRSIMKLVALAALTISVAGTIFFVFTGSSDRFMLYGNLLAIGFLFVLLVVIASPRLSSKYLVLQDRGVLAAGTFAFAAEALYGSLARPLGFEPSRILDHIGFGVLLFSFAYAALQLVLASERRLLSIENELAIAREIQTSILPDGVPEIDNLHIYAAYRPMTAVAGDFYEFVPVDQNRVGILVADVSGHGVPAALIASMIKVAMQSVVSCAHDPGAVLSELNRILSGQLRGQFVSAAYLWLNMENHTALYSGAGHPPLLRWREKSLERITEQWVTSRDNAEKHPHYPVYAMSINPGDRLLMYTDGLTKAENAQGDSFGDIKLEQVIRDNQLRSPSELANELFSEIGKWQPPSIQQDDVTLIVIDIVGLTDVAASVS